MRAVAIGFLVLAAGCGVPDPREDAVLFDDAGERTRRDLFAVHYSVNDEGAVACIVVPRSGPAVSRWELSPKAVALLRSLGLPQRRREEHEFPVGSDFYYAIDTYFAKLPAGSSEWTLPTDPEPEPEMDPRMKREGFRPEIERPTPRPSRVRILHVSKSGELKTLTLFKSDSKSLKAGVPAGGPAVKSIDDLFLWLCGPRDGGRPR